MHFYLLYLTGKTSVSKTDCVLSQKKETLLRDMHDSCLYFDIFSKEDTICNSFQGRLSLSVKVVSGLKLAPMLLKQTTQNGMN